MIILRPHMEIRLFRTVRGLSMAGGMALLMAWCLACSTPERKPDGLLSPEEMRVILRDIYIVEDKITRMQVGVDSSAQMMYVFKEMVLEKHKVSDSIFTASYDYYVDHPKELELIYSSLVDSLQLEEERSRSLK
jgi:hypothetical protein